jgi:hypothetical protein
VAVQQIHAATTGSAAPPRRAAASGTPLLDIDELTILTTWAEGVSEAAAYAPERIDALLAEACAGASWRAGLGLPEPSPRLADAIESLGRTVRAAESRAGTSLFDNLLTQSSEEHPEQEALDRLVRRALLSMLEERRTRQIDRSTDRR